MTGITEISEMGTPTGDAAGMSGVAPAAGTGTGVAAGMGAVAVPGTGAGVAPGVGAVGRVVVHFDDLDALGMLHNSRYAVLVERAMIGWWAERGVSFAGGRPSTPDAFNVVREYAITFHRPVRGTGEIEVRFWLEKMGASSADYRFRLSSPDGATVYAEGRRVNIRLDPATMRPTPWTDHGRAVAAELFRAPVSAAADQR